MKDLDKAAEEASKRTAPFKNERERLMYVDGFVAGGNYVQQQDRWIPVSEATPEKRIRVNTWDGLIVSDMYFDNDEKWKYTHPEGVNNAEEKAKYVTHWKNLPLPPTE